MYKVDVILEEDVQMKLWPLCEHLPLDIKTVKNCRVKELVFESSGLMLKETSYTRHDKAASHTLSRNAYSMVLLTLSLLTVSNPKLMNFSKITKPKITNKQHHGKVLLNSFPMDGHALGFSPHNQKFANFVSAKVLL